MSPDIIAEAGLLGLSPGLLSTCQMTWGTLLTFPGQARNKQPHALGHGSIYGTLTQWFAESPYDCKIFTVLLTKSTGLALFLAFSPVGLSNHRLLDGTDVSGPHLHP